MKTWLLVSVGWLSLALGVVGIFLPLLPTTPFVLLAAVCFSKGSPRFHQWLIQHRWFGPSIRNWQEHGVIPLKAKVTATLFLVPTTALMAFFSHWPRFVYLVVGSIICGVMLFIWTRKSRPN